MENRVVTDYTIPIFRAEPDAVAAIIHCSKLLVESGLVDEVTTRGPQGTVKVQRQNQRTTMYWLERSEAGA